MSIVDKVKIASHAACCGTYAFFFYGYHIDTLYVIAAVSYACLTLAEYLCQVKSASDDPRA